MITNMNYIQEHNIQYPDNDTYIPYVTENFSRDLTLLEIGAGLHSTRIFSEYFTKMYSIESNTQFENIYHNNYIHIDIDPKTGWYDKSNFENKLPYDYDIIFLDGPTGGHVPPFKDERPFRFGFCTVTWDVMRKDVPIIVDDIWRDWKERLVVEFLKQEGYACRTFEKFAVLEPK